MTIEKDITLGELLDRYPQSEDILMGFGMHCFHCPMSRMETLEEAAEVHDIDLDFLLEKLNNMDNDCTSCPDDCTCDDDEFCDCDDDCDCGCQDGEECTCGDDCD